MLDLTLFSNRSFTGANPVMLLPSPSPCSASSSTSRSTCSGCSATPRRGRRGVPAEDRPDRLRRPARGTATPTGSVRGRSFRAGCCSCRDRCSGSHTLACTSPSGASCLGCCSGASAWPRPCRRRRRRPCASVARDKAGVGSAVLNTSRQVGGALGIAILGRDRRSRDHELAASRATTRPEAVRTRAASATRSCVGAHRGADRGSIVACDDAPVTRGMREAPRATRVRRGRMR